MGAGMLVGLIPLTHCLIIVRTVSGQCHVIVRTFSGQCLVIVRSLTYCQDVNSSFSLYTHTIHSDKYNKNANVVILIV